MAGFKALRRVDAVGLHLDAAGRTKRAIEEVAAVIRPFITHSPSLQHLSVARGRSPGDRVDSDNLVT